MSTEFIVKYFVVPLLPFAGSAFVWLLLHLAAHFRASAKAGHAAHVMAIFSELVASLVASAEVDLRPGLAALGEGKLTEERAQQLRAQVLQQVKNTAPAALKEAGIKLLGEYGMEAWVKGLIERHAAALPPSAPPFVEGATSAPAS